MLEDLPLSNAAVRVLTSTMLEILSRFPPAEIESTAISGVVIAGFGSDEVFPSLISFEVDGIASNVLRYIIQKKVTVGVDAGAYIAPFAQSEMVSRFMDGVDPEYEANIQQLLLGILRGYPEVIIDSIADLAENERRQLKEKLANEAMKEFTNIGKKLDEFKQNRFSGPITSVVTMLSKDDLALMAESLVSLTSFKRKVSMEAETVGEPIDVAVISKGDGFIWMKRKHYFSSELNQHFIANYFREKSDGKKAK